MESVTCCSYALFCQCPRRPIKFAHTDHRGAGEDGSVAKIVKLEHACGDWTDGTLTDFKWSDFQGDVILWAVRWYCRYPISYRDLGELLAERRISVDHTTIYCWVLRSEENTSEL